MAEKLRCLVTGATGYIGGRLVPRLLDSGFAVRALARNPEKLANVPWRDRIEVARGDLSDPVSLEAAFEDVDVVYYLVHSMGLARDFAAEERRAAQNVVGAARRAGVRRIVYLSGLHPEGAELSKHLESRTTVGEILIASGIETVVLQAGVVVGSGSASFEMVRHLTDRLPVMTTPKWVHNKIQPIAIRDVLYYLVAAATCTVPESRAWDIGGPDVLEYGEMMQIYAEVAGLRRRHILVLPVLTPRIASLWVGLVTPIPPGLARPLVESLHCDAVMDNHDIDTIVPPPEGGLTPYRRSVSLALARIARGEVETTWNTGTAAHLPSDPEWAGEVVYTDTRSQHTSASPEQLWRAVESSVPPGWRVEERESGRVLKLRAANRGPGD
ncbi:MAG: NAD-dependent epimerase/dehydratase family protein, partial [Mycobacteriaceae bacterium]|nr:NAD-dependent epimerase/dehydratase family protein [Mycobacteriaceae bacterium]